VSGVLLFAVVIAGGLAAKAIAESELSPGEIVDGVLAPAALTMWTIGAVVAIAQGQWLLAAVLSLAILVVGSVWWRWRRKA